MTSSWKTAIPTLVGCIVLAVIIFAVGAKVGGNDEISTNTEQVHKLTTVVEKLQSAQDQRDCQAKANAAGFAVVLHSLAANFSTPPYPDPARKAAVDQMNATADFFANAASKPTGCSPADPTPK